MTFVAGKQDTSELNDLGYAGFTAPPLNHTFDGSRRVDPVLKSPIYKAFTQPADMGGDTAQYGDAFMRAQFDKIAAPATTSRLDNVGVDPDPDGDRPRRVRLAYQRPVGAWRTAHGMPTETIAGVADFGWFVNYILGVMDNLNVGPNVVPIFLTDNVMLYDGSYLNCCTIGFHGTPALDASTAAAHPQAAQQTLMFTAWSTPGTYSGFMTDYTGTRTAPSPTRGIADIHAFSHEVAEHLDDPFVNNVVKPWLTPTAPQYGCTDVLETGDPVVGVWYPLSGNNDGKRDGYNYYGQYHPEEEVFGAVVRARRHGGTRLPHVGRPPDLHGPAHDGARRRLRRLRYLLARLLATSGPESRRPGTCRASVVSSPSPLCLNGPGGSSG